MSSSRSWASAGARSRACDGADGDHAARPAAGPTASPSFARSVAAGPPCPRASRAPRPRRTLVEAVVHHVGQQRHRGVGARGAAMRYSERGAAAACRTSSHVGAPLPPAGPIGVPDRGRGLVRSRAFGSLVSDRRCPRPRPTLEQRLRGRVVRPSAHRWVTASAGSGSTSAQRAVGLDDPHAVGGVDGRSPAASTTARMTMPLAAHGVGTVRRSTWPAGSGRRSRTASAGSGRPARPAARRPRCRRTRAELGHDEAAAPVAAEDDALRRGRPGSARPARSWSTRLRRRGRRRPARRPGSWSPAARPRPLRRSAATRSSTTSSARSSSMIRPRLVDERRCRSPTGSKRTPKAARDDATSSPSRTQAARRSARGLGRRRSSRPVLTVSTSTPSRPSRLRQHQRGGAAGGVDDDLQAGLGDAGRCRRCAAARAGVGLERRGAGRTGRRSRRGRPGGTPAGRRPAPACAGRPGTGRRRARRGR